MYSDSRGLHIKRIVCRAFCGASEAERHLGVTLSVVCPSVCHTFGLLITFLS